MKYLVSGFLLLFSMTAQGQSTGLFRKVAEKFFPPQDSVHYQVVRGRISEKLTQQPLPGANVILEWEGDQKFGVVSDDDGYFKFERIRVGRSTIRVTYVGYTPVMLNATINSSRELVLDIPLEVSPVYLEEIKVLAAQDLAPPGGNVISTSDLSRHPGRPEAFRKVAVLPGAQNADDSRNDIAIRGNSPQSVLWRIEGINVPNPNHFNIPGTSGGPVSLITDKILAPSNFYSGAFPAEYGNTTSGIFDLKYRIGDSTRHDHTFQFGFLGAELTSEGPLTSRNRSSYIFTVRHSTLGIFNALNLDIGTQARPKYSDLSFKLNFPGKGKSTLWIFGLGGQSDVDILISAQKDPSVNLYGEKDRDQYFQSSMGVLGAGYKVPNRKGGFFSTTIAVTHESVEASHFLVYPDSLMKKLVEEGGDVGLVKGMPNILNYDFLERRISGLTLYTKKISEKKFFTAGLSHDFYFFDQVDSVRSIKKENFGQWEKRLFHKSRSLLLQPFAQFKYAAKNMDLVSGLHGQYLTLNGSWSVEPRLAYSYYIDKKSRLKAGFGLHSQMMQPYIYFYGQQRDSSGNPIQVNRNLDFTRSIHSVMGYERFFGDSSEWKFGLEVYHQRLYNVPVNKHPSSFSLINAGADFRRIHPGELFNGGSGKNYGIEAALEKSFSNGFLFLFTGSLFQSRYKGSDGIWRNTDFNSRYNLNVLLTYEWSLKKANTVSVGGKFTTAGGRWHGPVDLDSSARVGELVFLSETANSLQFDPYYRFDLRIVYKTRRNKTDYEFSLDIINALNTKNVLRKTYVPEIDGKPAMAQDETQLGLLPFFYIRIDFSNPFRK